VGEGWNQPIHLSFNGSWKADFHRRLRLTRQGRRARLRTKGKLKPKFQLEFTHPLICPDSSCV